MIDKRKEALKDGLRQLTERQLRTIRAYRKPMQLDKFNYEDGRFCPLAIGLGLDEWVKEPTHEKVYAILALAGYKVNNTWQVEGDFYTTDRERDLQIAVTEVIDEKMEQAGIPRVWY